MKLIKDQITLLLVIYPIVLNPFFASKASAVLYYDSVNKQIFTPICASCHSGAAPDAELDLTSYDSIKSKGIVVPNAPDKSLIVEKVVSGDMPAGGDPLNTQQIQLIKDWIQDGALDSPPAQTINIKSISPLFGSTEGGYSIEVVGENFVGEIKAVIGGAQCSNPKLIDSTKLTCVVPPSKSPGKVDVVLSDDTSTSILEKSFEYRLPLSPTFSSIYVNIFKPKCIGCHSSSNPPHGLDISTYESLMSHRRAIAPGNLDKSRLYRMISRGKMPLKTRASTPTKRLGDDDENEGEDDDGQAEPLSAKEIDAVGKWILEGALEN